MTIDINIKGVVNGISAVYDQMIAQGRGQVVNISSMGGRFHTPLGGWYHASKYSVEALSDAMRMELAPHGVRVAIIEPGAIRTEFGDITVIDVITPSGREHRSTSPPAVGFRPAGESALETELAAPINAA